LNISRITHNRASIDSYLSAYTLQFDNISK
jgi:hypothetical protein